MTENIPYFNILEYTDLGNDDLEYVTNQDEYNKIDTPKSLDDFNNFVTSIGGDEKFKEFYPNFNNDIRIKVKIGPFDDIVTPFMYIIKFNPKLALRLLDFGDDMCGLDFVSNKKLTPLVLAIEPNFIANKSDNVYVYRAVTDKELQEELILKIYKLTLTQVGFRNYMPYNYAVTNRYNRFIYEYDKRHTHFYDLFYRFDKESVIVTPDTLIYDTLMMDEYKFSDIDLDDNIVVMFDNKLYMVYIDQLKNSVIDGKRYPCIEGAEPYTRPREEDIDRETALFDLKKISGIPVSILYSDLLRINIKRGKYYRIYKTDEYYPSYVSSVLVDSAMTENAVSMTHCNPGSGGYIYRLEPINLITSSTDEVIYKEFSMPDDKLLLAHLSKYNIAPGKEDIMERTYKDYVADEKNDEQVEEMGYINNLMKYLTYEEQYRRAEYGEDYLNTFKELFLKLRTTEKPETDNVRFNDLLKIATICDFRISYKSIKMVDSMAFKFHYEALWYKTDIKQKLLYYHLFGLIIELSNDDIDYLDSSNYGIFLFGLDYFFEFIKCYFEFKIDNGIYTGLSKLLMVLPRNMYGEDDIGDDYNEYDDTIGKMIDEYYNYDKLIKSELTKFIDHTATYYLIYGDKYIKDFFNKLLADYSDDIKENDFYTNLLIGVHIASDDYTGIANNYWKMKEEPYTVYKSVGLKIYKKEGDEIIYIANPKDLININEGGYKIKVVYRKKTKSSKTKRKSSKNKRKASKKKRKSLKRKSYKK